MLVRIVAMLAWDEWVAAPRMDSLCSLLRILPPPPSWLHQNLQAGIWHPCCFHGCPDSPLLPLHVEANKLSDLQVKSDERAPLRPRKAFAVGNTVQGVL